MVAASASGSDVEKLKKKLRKRVTQALDEVCGEYASEQQQRTPLQQSDVSMDQTYGSCKKLVAYISTTWPRRRASWSRWTASSLLASAAPPSAC